MDLCLSCKMRLKHHFIRGAGNWELRRDGILFRGGYILGGYAPYVLSGNSSGRIYEAEASNPPVRLARSAYIIPFAIYQ